MTLRNKHDEYFEMKVLEGFEVDAESTQLLVIKGENDYKPGKWAERSFPHEAASDSH